MKEYSNKISEIAKFILRIVGDYNPEVTVAPLHKEYPGNDGVDEDSEHFDFSKPEPIENIYSKEEVERINKAYGEFAAKVKETYNLSDNVTHEVCTVWYQHWLSHEGYPYLSELSSISSSLFKHYENGK